MKQCTEVPSYYFWKMYCSTFQSRYSDSFVTEILYIRILESIIHWNHVKQDFSLICGHWPRALLGGSGKMIWGRWSRVFFGGRGLVRWTTAFVRTHVLKYFSITELGRFVIDILYRSQEGPAKRVRSWLQRKCAPAGGENVSLTKQAGVKMDVPARASLCWQG
jgi:hypothetical protein